MGLTKDLTYWNFSVHKCNLYSCASQAIDNWAHCCTQTVTLHFALKGRTPGSHYSGRNQLSMTTRELVTHDCQMWSDFGYLHLWWPDATVNPLWMVWMVFTNDWLSDGVRCRENIKQAKGNACSQYKNATELFSSSLPICPIHIFSSDTQACFSLVTSYNTACFVLVTSHNMSSNILH